VEAPGTAPGSEWFITTTVYFHSRRTGTPNIGGKGHKKQRLGRAILWFPLDRFLTVLASDSAPAVEEPDLAAAPAGLVALFLAFATMSLFAVGGAAAAVPEMHRIAVEVNHWMTDKQFTDAYAIARLSPGPNVLIVTLVGYAVAGISGALAATLAMCLPTALLACYVSRLLNRPSQSRWPGLIQAALVPLSIALMAASALILAQSTDRSIAALLLTAIVAVVASISRINPLWPLLEACWVLLALCDENR